MWLLVTRCGTFVYISVGPLAQLVEQETLNLFVAGSIPAWFTKNGRKNAPYLRKFKQQWITNGIVNTRISIDENIPNGFKKGRITAHR